MAKKPASAWTFLTAACLIALHIILALMGVIGRSVTADETAHVTAGYAYWEYNDYRLQPENGNLPQRWGSLPLLLARPTLSPAVKQDDWRLSRVWNIAQTFLFESGNNTDFLLLCARSMMLFWSICAGLLVFVWSRSMWGDAAGLGALALFSLSPTTLAHGPLVTSDMCAAVCLLAALAAWHRMCLQLTFRSILLAGVVTGLALLAKFSAVLLLPVFVAMGALAIVCCDSRNRYHTALRMAAAFGLAALVSVAVIWAFFGFRFAAADPNVSPFAHFYLPWETVFEKNPLWTKIVMIARNLTLLPEAFLYGFSFVMYFSGARGGFLAGNYSSTGWWWFFPFAFLVKSTVGELLITALLAGRTIPLIARLRAINWRRVIASPVLPLVLFAVVYGCFSLTSKLNIGQRHILPLYLVLFIVAGVLFTRCSSRVPRMAAFIALLIGAIETLTNSPHHLAFFNRLAGGPQNGWKLLVDSSLDWGQDIAALGRWVQTNRQPMEPVFVSCFGTADTDYEGIGGKTLSPYFTLGKPRIWFQLEPGLYCISATMLQDVYGIKPGLWSARLEKDFQYLRTSSRVNIPSGAWDLNLPQTGFHPDHPLWLLDRLRFARLCQYLKTRKPDAVINYTQFVFRLSTHEIDTFSNKPYSALVAMMGDAMAKSQGEP